MILRKNTNNLKKLTVFFTVFFLLIGVTFSQTIFALNSSGNKSTNFIGYRITNNTTLKIWIDKNVPSVDKAQFKIFQGAGTDGQQVQIESATILRESNNTSVSGLGGGADIVLTTSEALVSGQVYTVQMNNALKANNGLTVGQFRAHKDIIFSFVVPETIVEPNGGSTYPSSASAILNSWPQNGESNVAVEGSIWISTSVPVTNYSDVVNGLVLKKNNQQLQYDTSINSSKDGDIYAPLVSDDHTYFFFPMTGSGGYTSYNLDADAEYELTIPDMTLINGQTISGQTITFHTGGSTVATKVSSPSASASGDNLQIAWTAPAAVANVSPAPSGYNVYASTDKYWNYEKLNTLPITDTSFITSGLTPNTTYYFRVTALSDTNLISGNKYDVIEGGFSDAVQGTIVISVTGVTLDQSSKTLNIGDSLQLTAVVAPDNATNKAVSWSSSDDTVATVDQTGNVTAVAAGTATITVTTIDGSKTAECVVTVNPAKVKGVTLDNRKLTLKMGDSATLKATINPDNATNKNVTWKSSNEKVVTVKDGQITTVGIGTAVVTVVTEDGGKKASCTVKVEKIPVESVQLNKEETSLTMGENETETLTATINPDNATNKNVTWKSSNERVVKVDKTTGKLTAIGAGTAVVTVTTVDGRKKASCSVTVVDTRTRVTGVTLDNTKLTLKMGDSGKLTATLNPNDATTKDVVWKSSNEKVVTVNENGEITTVRVGTAVVTVTTKDGNKKAKCTIKVEKVPVESVQLNKEETSLTMGENETETLLATINPDNATNKNVTWKSSNERVVKVDKTTGKLTAIREGMAVITVTTVDGRKSASCTVTVNPVSQ